MSIRLNNYAKPMGKRGKLEYYKWLTFVDEPREKLQEIQSVLYTLHPTFPEPNQVRTNPNDNFALETGGWGEFNILVTVRYKDGREEHTQYHLNLSKPWPKESQPAAL